jgi:hypothetical protein
MVRRDKSMIYIWNREALWSGDRKRGGGDGGRREEA